MSFTKRIRQIRYISIIAAILPNKYFIALILLLVTFNANAEGLGDVPNIGLIDPPRGLVDLHHIERNAPYTVLAAAYVFHEKFMGYFSWDTDDDGVFGGLYITDLNDRLSLVGSLAFNSKKAGNHTIMGLVNLNYVIGSGNIGAGVQLEKGTDSDAAGTFGRQDTLSFRVMGGYDFPRVELKVMAEKYNYRNPTYREINSKVPDKDTSPAGLSAVTVEVAYTGFGGTQPYAMYKYKEFEGPLDDNEVRLGIRWIF